MVMATVAMEPSRMTHPFSPGVDTEASASPPQRERDQAFPVSGRGEDATANDARLETDRRHDDDDADRLEPSQYEQEEDVNDTDDSLELSLQKTLRIQCFTGLETRSTTFLYTTQLTHSNFVSTVVTSRVFSLKRRQLALQGSLRNASGTTGGGSLGSRNQDGASGGGVSPSLPATHVYSQPGNPKKVRNAQKGKYQAQLPTLRRSLPSLPIPAARLNQELVQERDKFMAQLTKERSEKAALENWAATKIQACYRGYTSRPRLVSFQFHRQLNSLRAIRLDVRRSEVGGGVCERVLR